MLKPLLALSTRLAVVVGSVLSCWRLLSAHFLSCDCNLDYWCMEMVWLLSTSVVCVTRRADLCTVFDLLSVVQYALMKRRSGMTRLCTVMISSHVF
jgi:hypothetical protein